MKKNTPNVATHLLTNPEQYLLKIGKFIRKTSLDELPNLINIIKGDIVFVGPRPALYNQDDLMALRVAANVDKLKPGITGWAQVMQGYAASEEETTVKLSYDLYYVSHYSLALDLLIVAKTIKTMLTGFGAR